MQLNFVLKTWIVTESHFYLSRFRNGVQSGPEKLLYWSYFISFWWIFFLVSAENWSVQWTDWR